MNLAQMRSMLADILTAGRGVNKGVGDDDFWTDPELDVYLNAAQSQVYQIIRRSRSDYFTKVMRTTDSKRVIHGIEYDPAVLKWQVGVGEYQLPPDFVRIKLICDITSVGQRVYLRASDIAKTSFKAVFSTGPINMNHEFLYDILGVKTLVIRPIPQEARDFVFVYEYSLPKLRTWSAGEVRVTTGNPVITFTDEADIQRRLVPGDELVVGPDQTTVPTADPAQVYPTVKSIDSPSQVTLENEFF